MIAEPTTTYSHPKYGKITFIPLIHSAEPDVGIMSWFVEDVELISSDIEIEVDDLEEVLNLLIEYAEAELSAAERAEDEAMFKAYESEVAEDFEAYSRRIDPTKDI